MADGPHEFNVMVYPGIERVRVSVGRGVTRRAATATELLPALASVFPDIDLETLEAVEEMLMALFEHVPENGLPA